MNSHPEPARIPIPPPKFSVKRDRYTSTIQICGWTVQATKRPILNGKEIESSVRISLRTHLP